MKNSDLHKLQKIQSNMLKDFKKICEKNNLVYFLWGGTMLGAIRHKGFIPWDDDIDVAMPVSDYFKLIELYKNGEIDSKYLLDCGDTNKYYWHSYGKLRLKNTVMVEKYSQWDKFKPGIFLDIFPFSDVVNLDKKVIGSNRKKLERYCNYSTIKSNIPYYQGSVIKKLIYKIILLFVPYKALIKKCNKILTLEENMNADYIFIYPGTGKISNEIFKKSDTYPFVQVEFDGVLYNVPNNYDIYLSQIYGDYMTLPPKEKRVSHNLLYVKFPDGKEWHSTEDIENGKSKN